jgi:uncharacterized protein YndB with AHSA1/START domain
MRMSTAKTVHSGRTLSLERVIKAPVELVFEAWTNQEHIKHWWGPNGFTNSISKMDVRPGGDWNLVMCGPDGRDYPNHNRYVEVVPNAKLVLEHVDFPHFLMTITFEPQGNNTLLRVTSEFDDEAVLMQAVREFGAAEGFIQNIDRMEGYLHAQDIAGALTITRTFRAPRALVWSALTEPTHFAQWWGPKGLAVTVAKMDVRPGGMAHYGIAMPGGGEMWGIFNYIDVQEPDKIVFTNSFADAQGAPCGNPFMPVWPLEIENTWTLAEQADGTTVLTLLGYPVNASAAERRAFQDMAAGLQQGFAGTFASLDHYLAVATQKDLLPVVVEHVLHAPVEKVWAAITDKDILKKWCFDIAAFEAIPGYEFTFEGGQPGGIVYIHRCKVVEVVPNRKLSYTWRFEGYAGDSLVSIELTPQGLQTHIRLTHADMENLEIERPDFAVAGFLEGWTHIVRKGLSQCVEG